MNARAACLHCGLPMGATSVRDFCCRGCAAVYDLLRNENLDRYYQLRGKTGSPIVDLPNQNRDLSWLEESVQEDTNSDTTHLRLDVQGIHCSACVWLIEKTFKQKTNALRLDVNPALGKIECWVGPKFPLQEWIRSVERFGYRFGPDLKTHNSRSDGLLLRLGICIALAINVMMLSAAIYLGLSEGRLYEVFRAASYGLASISVLIGAPIFIRSAIAGLRNRVLHLDVPISIGIVLAFAGSSWAFWAGRENALYLDSVSVFIALMLLGRYLQGRVLAANRDRLLASDGTAGLRSKRMVDGKPTTIKSTEIQVGDSLLMPPGDLIAVDSILTSKTATISSDWINGESRSKSCLAGQKLPAGSFNAGTSAIMADALSDWKAGPLEALLRPSAGSASSAHEGGLTRLVSGYYVAFVLVAASIGFISWLLVTNDIAQALEVATAVLVVTCPCAFGIATPLAHEIVHSKLRKQGLFLRSGNFLNQASKITKIVFDKTGTITTGALQLKNVDAVNQIAPKHRQVLFDMTSRSMHPVSVAIAQALQDLPLVLGADAVVNESTGQGLEMYHNGHRYRLGRPAWAASQHQPDDDTLFSCDDVVLARFQIGEQAREDAAHQIGELRNDGYELFLLSGDNRAKVQSFADRMGILPGNTFAEQTPVQKQQWIEKHDQGDLLFLGDGINDSLAAQAASCSGTPALDRPYMASHCDFYLATEQLAPIRAALKASQQLGRVIRRNLFFALFYNVTAISLAWAGLMSPWLAAILMPLSSIIVVSATTFSLAPRSSNWKS